MDTESQLLELTKTCSRIEQKVDDVIIQTTKTNGTVRTHDAWINEHKGKDIQKHQEGTIFGIMVVTIATLFASVIGVIVEKFFK